MKGDRMGKPLLRLVSAHGDRTIGAVEVPPEIQIVFHLAEVRQDFEEGPLVIAPGGPVIVVLRDAAVENLPIDGAGAPGRLAAGYRQLGLLWGDGRHISPAMRAIGRQPHIVAELKVIGEMLEVRVIRSGLEEEHRSARILRQASREDTTSRACADDNHVVFHPILSSIDLPHCDSRSSALHDLMEFDQDLESYPPRAYIGKQ